MTRTDKIITSGIFKATGVIHGVSTKQLGNMALSRDFDGTTAKNLEGLFGDLGIDLENSSVVFLNLTHSGNIALLERIPGRTGKITLGQNAPEVVKLAKYRGIDPPKDFIANPSAGIDACISNSRGLFLAILPADCAPVFVYDPQTHYFGIIHAGVLGAFSEIVPHTIRLMETWCKSDPRDLLCYIGPCVTSKIYHLTSSGLWQNVLLGKVDQKLAEEFDLKLFLNSQLLSIGVRSENIEISAHCTGSETDLFFSNYSVKTLEQKKKQGRNLALIGRP